LGHFFTDQPCSTMRKIGFFAILFVIVCNSVSFSQGNPALQNIVTKLKAYSASHIAEKAYLQFDKPYYTAGDTMYFKAYMTIGERHELSKTGSILHVDLIDPSNIIINNIILHVNNSMAWGDLSLPDMLKAGAYRIRAYTRYMQNEPRYFFDKTIAISSSHSINSGEVDTRQAVNPDMQFFPEGGELIASVISKVAFKAIGTNGMGMKAKGTIVDNANLQVATFSSNDLGMGFFYIQPEAGKTYKAKITFANGTQSTIALPVVADKGIVLHVTDTTDKVGIEIVCNKAYLQENMNKDINLLIYSNGLLSQVTTKLDNKEMGMDLPKAKFPSGVLRITLFSQDGEPLSERLVFLKNQDMLNLSVSSDKPSYKTREKVTVNLVSKSKGVAAGGFLSAAVVDESKVPYRDDDETTILSYLLLSSELKGYIEKPNYYFVENTAQRDKDLDALMLTQGYRRFDWKQLATDTTHYTYAPEKSLSISGIEKNSAGAPMANKDVMLLTTKTGNMLGEKTDKSGAFRFDNIDFDEGTQFALQATGSSKDKNSSVIALVKGSPEPPVEADPLTDQYTAQLMKTFIHGQKIGEPGKLPGNVTADQELSSADLNGSTTFTAALASHLNGVTFNSGIPYLKGNKYPMLIVVDGKIRGSLVKLDNLSTQNISKVQLLKGKNADAYGINGSSGVLVINTVGGSSGADLNAQNDYKYEAQNAVKVKNNDVHRADDDHYRSSNLAGPGHADQVLHADAFENATSLITALNGRLRGVDFENGVATLRGNAVVSGGGGGVQPMYIVVDGVPGGSLENINPHNVETVEVLKGANASIYGVAGGPGVIVITTRQQSDDITAVSSSIGSLRFRAHGFYKAREFYSPKYDVSSAAANAPDQRSTLYWNPNIVTDSNGSATFQFYNADGRGSKRVIVEGVDANGNVGWQVYRYNVE